MELSQKLKQARLDAGLSQKALCGDRITRNMLSQIENGSARPSMDTLRYLAAQLGKPLSYFLEDDAVTSPNQALMEQVRAASPSDALHLLGSYKAPDPTFDAERWLLEALTCLILAEDALSQGKPAYARSLLERAQVAGSRTPYYTAANESRRLFLRQGILCQSQTGEGFQQPPFCIKGGVGCFVAAQQMQGIGRGCGSGLLHQCLVGRGDGVIFQKITEGFAQLGGQIPEGIHGGAGAAVFDLAEHIPGDSVAAQGLLGKTGIQPGLLQFLG